MAILSKLRSWVAVELAIVSVEQSKLGSMAKLGYYVIRAWRRVVRHRLAI